MAWNTRGLNGPQKQKDVKHFLLNSQCGLVGLLETKIKAKNFAKFYSSVCDGWCVASNLNCHKGGRIILLWLDTHFQVNIRHISAQCIHFSAYSLAYKLQFDCSMIYAFNGAQDRKQLWEDLRNIKAQIKGPWIITGDFNCPLTTDDRIGSPVQFSELADFKRCMEDCDLTELVSTGAKFTWSNNQHGEDRVYSKLDRCLINDSWLDLLPNSFVHYPTVLCSDHSPGIISLDQNVSKGKKSFLFFDMWCKHDNFKNEVQEAWNQSHSGTPMYIVVQKLKETKKRLKKFNFQHFSNIEERAQTAKNLLQEAKMKLQAAPTDQTLIQREIELAGQYKNLKEAYDSYIFQRAKVQWLKEGDTNSKFFHRSIKLRRFQQRVLEIRDKNGILQNTPEAINKAFEEFYKDLLGSSSTNRINIKQDVVNLGQVLTDAQAHALTLDFTDKEIKDALFSIPGAKAPGPDGFNSTFFKETWPITGDEVCSAVKDFFTHGKLLKQINCTKLTLIPKVHPPQYVSEFRPIACCNTIYKVITKLICTRLKDVLPSIIAPNQAGFIHGRQIFHNVSIVQDLVGSYNRKSTPPCCMLKVDIRKAYDSVEWGFLHEMMMALNFPKKFVDWVMACVTTASYSLCVNGASYGFFQGERGLRQGDPMSPLLFVICMEYLSRLLMYAGLQKNYLFHYRCKKLALNHLVFADDLIIFSKGDYDSILWNLRSLATFAASSGLCANAGKSAIYSCNMDRSILDRIIQETGYSEDTLPFSYLGVKISAKKLNKDDCQFLIDRIVARIRSWGSRTLSYAGRCQLVNSVLLNLHSYWASIFVLPKKVLDGVISICRSFLWDGKSVSNKSPLVAWDFLCRPKKQGGLGFKESHTWNAALLGKYIWSVANKEENLWVKWIDHVYLKGKDWKHYAPTTTASWYWRQLTHIKDRFRSGYSGDKWAFGKNGYSAASGYNWLRGELHEVEWAKWVWNRLNIPKHSFLNWLIMWKRLNTRDRLRKIGLHEEAECPLCGKSPETADHLFVQCDYVQACRLELSHSLRITPVVHDLQSLCDWLQKPVAGRFRNQVIQSAFVALHYNVWMQRNSAVWNKCISLPHVVAKRIKSDIFMRITSVLPRKTKDRDKKWLSQVLL